MTLRARVSAASFFQRRGCLCGNGAAWAFCVPPILKFFYNKEQMEYGRQYERDLWFPGVQ